nr:MAG: hypothetical protein 2 [Barnaviridae sp.]
MACAACIKHAAAAALRQVPRDSTPGIPWSSLSSTNAGILDDDEKFDIVLEATVARVTRLKAHGDKVHGMSASELVENGLADPIRLFVKGEPHASKKFRTGKYRLISGVSIVDQAVRRMCCSMQNNAEIDRWSECASKPGISLSDEGQQRMAQTFREMLERSGTIQATDVSGWDWSVQEWELWFDMEARILLAEAPTSSEFAHLLRQFAHLEANKVFIMPDGQLIGLSFPGIQTSGSYNTSSGNSRMRVGVRLVADEIVAQRTGVEVSAHLGIVAMGDDSVEEMPMDGVLSEIRRIGHTIKDVTQFETLDGVEFCSHQWRDDGLASAVNVTKTLFRYFSHPPTSPEYPLWFTQLAHDLRRCGGIESIMGYARQWAGLSKHGQKAASATTPEHPGGQFKPDPLV